MNSTAYNVLMDGLKSLGISFTEDMISKVDHYLSFYNEWNDKMNISSILDEEKVLTRHFLDSLAPLPLLKSFDFWQPNIKLIDLGTGGGFPGIPLKIFESEIDLDLAEVNKKKICFLNEVILNLPLQDVKIVDTSISKVNETYHFLITRAFGSLKKILQESRKYVKNGKVIAYKGRKERIDKEISDLHIQKQETLILEKIETPFLNEERHIVIIDI